MSIARNAVARHGVARNSVAHAITQAGAGGGFTPASLFGVSDTGGDYSRITLTNTFSDTAGTTPATVNAEVASLRASAGTVPIVAQSTGAAQPILRGTPTGANLAAADGNFFTPGNWTAGAGWAIADAVATATTSSAALDLAGLTATNGKVYLIRYYVTRSAGTVTLNFGGVAGTARSATGIYEDYITASGTGALSFTTSGFTGTVSQIQVWDASADAVGAPYFLWLDGSNDALTAAYVQSAYPLTLVADCEAAAESASGAAPAIWQSDTAMKALRPSTSDVDWQTGTISFSGGGKTTGQRAVTIAEFTDATLTSEDSFIAGTPVANTHTFGTSSSVFVGKIRSASIYARLKLYGFMFINRTLTSAEKLQVHEYMAGWRALSCWGDSMTAGSGTAIAANYVTRIGRDSSRIIFNGGAGGETSTQITARFVADTTNKDRWINVFWMGTNDSWAVNGWSPTLANIATCVAGVSGGRYIVLGVTRDVGGGTTAAALDDLDAQLSALYGERFLDIRAYLQSKNDGSANDLADIADGLVPRSLRSDTIHLNDTGYQHVAEAVQAKLVALGWA